MTGRISPAPTARPSGPPAPPGRGARRAALALASAAGLAAAPLSPAAAVPTAPGGVCASAPASDLIDVPTGAYYRGDVDCLAALQIDGRALVQGYPDGTFRPDGVVRRDEAALFTARLYGYLTDGYPLPDPEAAANLLDLGGVTDAQRDAITALVGRGVVNGTTSQTYSPDRLLTRGQLASLLVRSDVAARDEGTDTAADLAPAPDFFADDRGSVHEAAINTLRAAGVYLGRGDGSADADAPLTRAQLVAFFSRYLTTVTDSSEPGLRASLVQPTDLPAPGAGFEWRLAGRGSGLPSSTDYFDPCGGAAYPADADRQAGRTQDLAVAETLSGETPELPTVRELVVRHSSADAAAAAFDAFLAAGDRCVDGDGEGLVDPASPDLALVQQRFDGTAFTYYVVVARAGDEVALARHFPGEAVEADDEARAVAAAVLDALQRP